jgi:hypothetical protein
MDRLLRERASQAAQQLSSQHRMQAVATLREQRLEQDDFEDFLERMIEE